MVDGSGLEIRIQDFALIWTGLDGSVLLSRIHCATDFESWSGVDRIARKCFSWVTFAGYVQKVGLNESLRVIISIQVEKETDTASERKDVSS